MCSGLVQACANFYALLSITSQARRSTFHVQIKGQGKSKGIIQKSLHDLESLLEGTGETYTAYLDSYRSRHGNQRGEAVERDGEEECFEEAEHGGQNRYRKGTNHLRVIQEAEPEAKHARLKNRSLDDVDEMMSEEIQGDVDETTSEEIQGPGQEGSAYSSSSSSSSGDSRKRKRDPSCASRHIPALKGMSEDDAVRQFWSLLVGDPVEVIVRGDRCVNGRVTKLLGTEFIEIRTNSSGGFTFSCEVRDFQSGQVRKKPAMRRVD